TAQKRDSFGRRRMSVSGNARPGAAVGVPEVALQLIGLVGVFRDEPAEENVVRALARVLEEPLSQIQIVAADALGDLTIGPDALQEIDAGPAGRHGSSDVRLGQTDRGLDSRRGRKSGKER